MQVVSQHGVVKGLLMRLLAHNPALVPDVKVGIANTPSNRAILFAVIHHRLSSLLLIILPKSKKTISRHQDVFRSILNCPQHFRRNSVVSAVRALKIFEDEPRLVHSLGDLGRVGSVNAGSQIMARVKGLPFEHIADEAFYIGIGGICSLLDSFKLKHNYNNLIFYLLFQLLELVCDQHSLAC